MFVKLRFSLQDPHRSCHFINSVSSFGIGGCYVYLFSPVLVTLHSAEPRGQVAPQMCSPVLSSHWAVTFLDVPRCLGVTGLLSGESSAQRQAVRSATSLTGEQWSLDPGFCGSPPPPPLPLLPNNTSTSPAAPPSIFTAALSLSYSPPWASSAAQPHCHSAGDGWPGKLGRGQRLHNGYSISYQERPAARLEAILLCPWTQTPERHAHTRKVWKQQGKTKWRKKKGSREGTQKTKKNGFLLQQSPQLLLSVAPRNYHIIKLFNKMENIISVLQHAAWLIWTCSKKTDCFDHKPKKTILLVWRSDVMSSVAQGIPAACGRARLPRDGGPMLTAENYWPASSWCPMTASDQPRQLIIQHLRSDDSTQWGTTLESPWVF